MKIAIHAADLDYGRIDGPRVYIFNILKNFGKLDAEDSFFIYHRSRFNPKLEPPKFSNYFFQKTYFPFLWTQLCFAIKVFFSKCDVVWIPVQNLPFFRRKKMKSVVTIHDLAFKIFPQYFTKKDLFKLNKLADIAIRNSDKIIAISNTTKKDILKFYPEISEEKITTVYNGFDNELFGKKTSTKDFQEISKNYKISAKNYLLYVGAIQPRKNLNVLIDAFEKIKRESERQTDLKLVIAGAPAWKYEPILQKISGSPFGKDIVVTGTVPFEHLPIFYQNSLAFVFPPLYEGFGIPILEAMASGTPVICAKNSSLLEVAGGAALYFETENSRDLACCVEKIISDSVFRDDLIKKGFEQSKNFSWEKCAGETLKVLLD